MIYLYCVTFPNLKKYIGVTKDVNHRFRNHKISRLPVGRAMRSYKTWNVKILGMFESYDEAYVAERTEIKLQETLVKEHGYNICEGGKGPSGYTAWNKGKPFPQEIRDKVSKTLGATPVNVFKNGVLIGTWTNLNRCSQDLGLYRGNITHCLSGKLKTTGGYSFERI